MSARPAGPSWEEALRQSGILDHLADFDPHVVGTLPLGISVPGSDIDIVCCAPDAMVFAETLWRNFGNAQQFNMRQWIGPHRPVVASFIHLEWPFEIFGAAQPVHDQPGWRHFDVERRLLSFAAPSFRDAVMRHRNAGMKTEPAFAKVLGLRGDPYEALYALSDAPDASLRDRLNALR